MNLSVQQPNFHFRHEAVARPTSTFRRDIEGLRAIAILAVVCFHFGVPGMTGGFIGVDIFFVISGYLISSLLINELDDTGRIDLLRFYGRRARRLLPTAFLVTLVVLICGAFVLSPLEQLTMAKGAVASSFYASNFWLLRQTFDYFSPESRLNPFLHTWALSVEEQFYIVWPAFLILAGNPKIHPRLPAIAVAAVTIVSFVLCLWLTHVKQPWAFYATPARAWEFGLGALASFVPVTQWLRGSKLAPAIGWFGAALLSVSFAVIDDESRFPGPDALFPAVGTVCLLLGGASTERRGPALLLRAKPLQWIGSLSYPIYLWHWPIIVYATVVDPPLSSWGRLACAALTLICAVASYRLIERPLRWHRWLSSQTRRSIALGAALTLACGVIGVGAGIVAKRFASSPVQKMIDNETTEESIASAHRCLVGFTDSEPVACTFGATSPVRTIVLFGDSHADQWSTPIVSLAQQERWRVVTYLKASCAVADVPVYNIRLHRLSPECAKWRSEALSNIVRLQPDAVVIGQFSDGYIEGAYSDAADNNVGLADWSEGLQRSLRTLSDSGIPVVLLRDTPTQRRNVQHCLARADWQGLSPSSCATPRSSALNASVAEVERNVVATIPSAHFVDLSSEFCDPTTCPSMREGTIVYRDNNHLTAAYAKRLFEPLKNALIALIHSHGCRTASQSNDCRGH